jgi:predicted Rossmann fold nucleotide-binding protein DprA/Smf involved in DNA uptake
LNIVSGGARGVDSIAENVANSSDGTTVIFVADSLEKKIRQRETREAIMRKQSIILSSFRPDMPFQTFAAMERNKYVYALSDFVVVVSSDYNKGGTWAGATENLKRGWVPMFVRKEDEIPQGNINLLKKENVYPITQEILNSKNVNIFDWFASQSKKSEDSTKPQQMSMLDL